MIQRFAPLFCACLLAFTAARAAAQPVGQAAQASSAISIAAVVNDEIVTVRDVQARIGLLMVTAGLQNSPEMQQRLRPQVVDTLINERLKMQEARRLNISITQEEIRTTVQSIEQRNGMAPGALRAMAEERGLDIASLYQQIEADSAWVKVAQEHLSRGIVVTPSEVKAVIDRLRANQGKPEYDLMEIVLPLNPSVNEQTMRDFAARLVQQIRAGAPFEAAAQQFSQSATAAVGGELGWVLETDLEGDLARIVPMMQPNQVSDPIRMPDSYRIIMMRGRRASGEPDPLSAVVTLSQIYLPTEGGRALPADTLASASSRITGEAKSCEQMNALGKELGGPGSGPVPLMYVGSLPNKVRDEVRNLPVGRVSLPIAVGGARLYVMVCSRQADTGLPNELQVTNMLQNTKLDNIARQRLRDLRRQALVDVRL